MLSVIITTLLLGVMLLIITTFLIGARREYSRHKQRLAIQLSFPAHPLDSHVTAILHLHEGNIVGIEEPAPAFTLPPAWYSRRRTLVSLGFLIMLLLTLFAQTTVGEGPIQSFSHALNLTFQAYTQPTDVRPAAQSATLPLTASIRLQRVNSALRDQYYSDYQWQTWSYSSCSGIAMEMVMNSYGRHLIAADVLQKEQALGVWDVQLGLLGEQGIAMTAATFGFTTDASHSRTVQDLVRIANQGSPIIVGVRDSVLYPGGHIFVVRGGDSQYVYIADSSPANFQRMSYPMFTGMWQGFSAILKPQN